MSLISKRTTYLAAITLAIAATITSCNSNKDTQLATELLDNAELSFKQSNYESTIIILDSLKSKYPRELDIQRQGLYLRTMTNEQLVLAEIRANDTIIQQLSEQKQRLDKQFSFVKTKDMVEGYHVVKNIQPLINRTGFEARIDQQGNIYIVTLVHGNSLKHTRISVSAGDGTVAATDDIAYNGSTNYRFNDNGVNNEMVTFRDMQCDSLNRYIKENSNKTLKLTFIGDKRHTITLSKSDKNMIINSYNYSQAIINGRNAEAKKIYLDKKLKIAESQITKSAQIKNSANQ
ncbi:MAG: hypothetical protein R3Y22_06370 [Bacteroidales bacterium]